MFHVWLFLIRSKRSGDIEQNPGPKPNSCHCQSFSIYHWNLNSIWAHNLIKLSLLTLPTLFISESCIKIKINLNVYFHTSLWCLKRFYEDLKGLHETFWGTAKKCENKNFKLIFSLRLESEREGLRPYIAIYKFDVVCLPETYLKASISSYDVSLEVPGYNLFKADHPSNTKRGDACIYYRNSLFLKILGIHYLQECINFEIIIGGKLCIFVF